MTRSPAAAARRGPGPGRGRGQRAGPGPGMVPPQPGLGKVTVGNVEPASFGAATGMPGLPLSAPPACQRVRFKFPARARRAAGRHCGPCEAPIRSLPRAATRQSPGARPYLAHGAFTAAVAPARACVQLLRICGRRSGFGFAWLQGESSTGSGLPRHRLSQAASASWHGRARVRARCARARVRAS